MRCPHCGQIFADDVRTCPRCAADLRPSTRRRELLVTIVMALIAICAVAVLTYVVLMWHDSQMLG